MDVDGSVEVTIDRPSTSVFVVRCVGCGIEQAFDNIVDARVLRDRHASACQGASVTQAEGADVFPWQGDLSDYAFLLDRLRYTRVVTLKMSQREVAEAMDVHPSTVSRLEARLGVPGWVTLERYARALGVDVRLSAVNTREHT